MSEVKARLRSSMKWVMCLVLAAGAGMCMLFAVLFLLWKAPVFYTLAVSAGMVAYHMLIRFAAPVLLMGFHKQYDHQNWWFREKRWEAPLYQRMNVRAWKKHVPSWDPAEFSLEKHTLPEIVNNMCHSEAVHETIMLLCFTSLLFAIPFGDFPVFLITAMLSAAVDSVFVILQRYNRPRMVAMMERWMRRAERSMM